MRLIDADALLDTTNWLVFADNKVDVAYVQVTDIMRQPTVDAVPVVHGHWINAGGYCCGDSEFACSVCGEKEWRTGIKQFIFCPFCGAKMDEVTE